MCGLFGVMAPTVTEREREMFVQLGQISSLRGEDSTGIIVGARKKKHGNKVKIIPKKAVENPVTFFSEWEVINAVKTEHSFLLAGHARAATSGKINLNNAHPIQSGDIFLMHNGTISKWDAPKGQEETTSDSRIFAGKISGLGAIKAFEEADTGAYAVTFLDTHPAKRTFSIARNPGRTLYVAMSLDGEAMMWASEAMFIELVLGRNGVAHNWGEPGLLELGRMYTWKFGDKAKDGQWKQYKTYESKITVITPPIKEVGPTSPFRPASAEEALDSIVAKYTDDEGYQEWLRVRANSYGDPAFEEELNDEHDPTTVEMLGAACEEGDKEQLIASEIICGDCERLTNWCQCEPKQATTSAVGSSYCRKCCELGTICKCKSSSLFYPHPWQLDSKGRLLPEATKTISGSQPLGEFVPDDGVVIARTPEHTLPRSAYHGKSLGDYDKQRDSDNDTYIGFGKQPFAPSIANEKLKDGCSICSHTSIPTDTVYWFSDFGHICSGCKGGEYAHSIFGPVTMFPSRYIKGDSINVSAVH